jgi:hypothetical protein
MEDVLIYVARNLSLSLIINQIIRYIDWINNSETMLKAYYETKLGEKVFDTWYSEIEV